MMLKVIVLITLGVYILATSILIELLKMKIANLENKNIFFEPMIKAFKENETSLVVARRNDIKNGWNFYINKAPACEVKE